MLKIDIHLQTQSRIGPHMITWHHIYIQKSTSAILTLNFFNKILFHCCFTDDLDLYFYLSRHSHEPIIVERSFYMYIYVHTKISEDVKNFFHRHFQFSCWKSSRSFETKKKVPRLSDTFKYSGKEFNYWNVYL